MAKTPTSIKVDIDWSRPELKEALDTAQKVGRIEGVEEGLKAAIDFLEDAFINDTGRPDRGTPKADAILELARACGIHLRKKLKELKNNA